MSRLPVLLRGERLLVLWRGGRLLVLWRGGRLLVLWRGGRLLVLWRGGRLLVLWRGGRLLVLWRGGHSQRLGTVGAINDLPGESQVNFQFITTVRTTDSYRRVIMLRHGIQSNGLS